MQRALEQRLREIAAAAPATERELRTLAEKGAAWERTLGGLIAASERMLQQLYADPESSLSAVGDELERVEDLRHEHERIRVLLAQLDERSRKLRTEWLARQARSGSPR